MGKISKSYDGLDMASEDFKKELDFIFNSTGGSSDYRNDRKRPYNGQPHTDQGKRGKTKVKGLTMRDVMDCFVMGYLGANNMSEKVENGSWRYNDVYKSNDFEADPIAIGQGLMVNIEKMMGIFPNIPACVPTGEELIKHWGGEEE